MPTKSNTYRHPGSAKQRVNILLSGKDIAPYLYGRAALIETTTYVNQAMLNSIAEQVNKLPRGSSLFGVQLRTITAATVKVSDKLLRLNESPAGITKSIVEITGIEEKDGRVYANTHTLFPPWYEGGTGFFDTSLLDEREEFSSCPTLYLHFSGKIPEVDEKNFFSTIMNFAGEFKLLVECWAMAFEKELRDPKYLSHDPYEGAWLTGFTRKHGNAFQHKLVHQYLGSLDFDQRLTGINKIYDTRRPFREVDLITPLLHQMQTDILEVMREEPELVSLLFNEQNSDQTKRRLRTLFERYFGPKSLIGMPRNLFAEEEEKNDKNPTRRARILPSIITLINRGACEAEREAARHIYRHITGHDYPR